MTDEEAFVKAMDAAEERGFYRAKEVALEIVRRPLLSYDECMAELESMRLLPKKGTP